MLLNPNIPASDRPDVQKHLEALSAAIKLEVHQGDVLIHGDVASEDGCSYTFASDIGDTVAGALSKHSERAKASDVQKACKFFGLKVAAPVAKAAVPKPAPKPAAKPAPKAPPAKAKKGKKR